MILTTTPKPSPSTGGLAWDGSRLWTTDHANRLLIMLDTHGTTASTFPTPGLPHGIAFADGRLAAVIADPKSDDRSIRFFDVASSQWDEQRLACPDDSGSQLAWDGGHLWLAQRHNRTVLQLHDDGTVKHAIETPHDVTGVAWVGATMWLNLRVDTEVSEIAKRGPGASRVAQVERFDRRLIGLAYDGDAFWMADTSADALLRVRE